MHPSLQRTPHGGGTRKPAVPAVPDSLRADLDRALTRTMAWLFPFLLLQSVPSFLAQRAPNSTLAPVSLVLAGLPCLLVVAALHGQRSGSGHRWLLVAASGYLPVVCLEGLDAAPELPIAYLPWLLTIAPPFIACFAMGAQRISTWVLGTLLATGAVAVVYSSRLPLDRLTMTVLVPAAFTSGAFAGVRALRRRADRAEAAQRDARARYDESQRRIALEEERVRTDALLHDSLLNTLLIAAAAGTARTRADAARSAGQAITVLEGRAEGEGPTSPRPEGRTVYEALVQELGPLHHLVRLDLAAAEGLRIPSRVSEAVAAAALQAVNNSVKHAGLDALRSVLAEPLGSDGVQVTISDDGRGFDPDAVAPERLGVKVSILGRMEAAGGAAVVRSTLGSGTAVVLGWVPTGRASLHLADDRDAVHA